MLSFPVFGKFQGNQFGSQGLRSNKKTKQTTPDTLYKSNTTHNFIYTRCLSHSKTSSSQKRRLSKFRCGLRDLSALFSCGYVSVKNVYVSIFIYLVYKSNHHLQNYCLWGYKTLYTNRAALKTHLSI